MTTVGFPFLEAIKKPPQMTEREAYQGKSLAKSGSTSVLLGGPKKV